MAKDAQGTCDGSIGADRPVTGTLAVRRAGLRALAAGTCIILPEKSRRWQRQASCAGVSPLQQSANSQDMLQRFFTLRQPHRHGIALDVIHLNGDATSQFSTSARSNILS